MTQQSEMKLAHRRLQTLEFGGGAGQQQRGLPEAGHQPQLY